jgi:hypothetical protein
MDGSRNIKTFSQKCIVITELSDVTNKKGFVSVLGILPLSTFLMSVFGILVPGVPATTQFKG